MTIAEYQALTGITVPDEDVARYKAIIRRSESKLGSLLGYSLSKQKTWTEKGKMGMDGLVPFPALPVDQTVIDSLEPADDQVGDIQLFNLDELDTHIRINPAKEVYGAKIVLPINEDEFITIYDLANGTPYLNSAGLVVAITKFYSWFTWTWYSLLSYSHRSSLMLAVDGEFVDVCNADEHEELAYLLADMVTYYADPNYSVMGNIRSESIDSHSYSRASTGKNPDEAAPQGQKSAKQIIERYAGPGAFRKLVR